MQVVKMAGTYYYHYALKGYVKMNRYVAAVNKINDKFWDIEIFKINVKFEILHFMNMC
jgi:ABC-type microcin C transport system permease subunit YejB